MWTKLGLNFRLEIQNFLRIICIHFSLSENLKEKSLTGSNRPILAAKSLLPCIVSASESQVTPSNDK